MLMEIDWVVVAVAGREGVSTGSNPVPSGCSKESGTSLGKRLSIGSISTI